jgi:hypothetical protein
MKYLIAVKIPDADEDYSCWKVEMFEFKSKKNRQEFINDIEEKGSFIDYVTSEVK